jgi:hypothetical protein
VKVGEGSALGRAFELTAGAGLERPAWGADRVGEEEALQARLLARLEAESGGSGTAEEGEGVGMLRDRSGGADGTGWQVNKCYRSRRSELVRWGSPGRTDENICRCFGAPACRVFPHHLIT